MFKTIKKVAKAEIRSWDPDTDRKPKIMKFLVFKLFLDPRIQFSPWQLFHVFQHEVESSSVSSTTRAFTASERAPHLAFS
jgi:hypothetical protein